LLFIKIIAQDVWTNTPAYMQGWVGVYGYNYWPVPALTYLLYPLTVIILTWRGDGAAHFLDAPVGPDRRARLTLAGLFIVGYLLTIISLYVAFTPVRSLLVAGVQGRYFTVVMPLLFLALLGLGGGDRAAVVQPSATPAAPSSLQRFANQHSLSAPQIPTSLPIGLGLVALCLYMLGLGLSYHVPCGSEYYQLGLCYQPEYKNWAPESLSSAPVSPALTLKQEIVPACNGMTELSVWVNSNGTDPTALTNLTLRSPAEGTDLVQQTFKNANVPREGWLAINFSPQWQSQGQLYVLKLTGSSAGGIQAGYSERSEYLKGKLYENDTPVSQDLLFQYGCIAGLQKWLGAGP
jgi:hypothetical protein